MPIEIRELHIKAVVGTPTTSEHTRTSDRTSNEQERESLVANCVERVMEILLAKAER